MLPKLLLFTFCYLLAANTFAQFNPNLTYGEVKDVEGNTYKTIQIGTQTWMAENLNVTNFRNGDPIIEVKDSIEWIKAGENKQPAWCYYNNDPANGTKYGKLYNWYAVNDPRGLAPEGWYIPSDSEWTILADYLGGGRIAGKKMKNISGWEADGNGTNEYGFSAIPGGGRALNGQFMSLSTYSYCWSSTGFYSFTRCDEDSFYIVNLVGRSFNYKVLGFSVRCLRD